MTTKTAGSTAVAAALKVSWAPLLIIVLAQLQMGININALPVSLGPIVEDLNAPATAVSTALVLYSLFVAAFVMLGAKIGKMFGERLVFQVSALAHGMAMALMAISINAEMMNIAQAVAGIAAAALVPDAGGVDRRQLSRNGSRNSRWASSPAFQPSPAG